MNKEQLKQHLEIESQEEFKNILRGCSLDRQSTFSKQEVLLIESYHNKLSSMKKSCQMVDVKKPTKIEPQKQTTNNNIIPGGEKQLQENKFVLTRDELLEFGKEAYKRGRNSLKSTLDDDMREKLFMEIAQC